MNTSSKINFKKENARAIGLLIIPLVLFSFMLSALKAPWEIYLIGQVAGSVFFMQCFILLHECGHLSFFKSPFLNKFFGHIFSFFVFIPFKNWQLVHALHHEWTGYRDLDPTTEKTFDSRLNDKQRHLINFCWKYSVPLFTLGYRFGIYWKAEKLKRHLSKDDYKICLLSMLVYIILYAFMFVWLGSFVFKFLPALYLSFVMTDILSLSQHSNIAMPTADGKVVSPMKYSAQAKYSRSLIFPPKLAHYILFNFNYHEAHHYYPGLSCYHLPKVSIESINAYDFWPWLLKVKKVPGVDFIFKTSPDRSQY